MTRREAEKAVIEAVLSHDHAALINGTLSPRLRQAAIDYRDQRRRDADLNACTEPDLDALNAAVAEAVDKFVDRMIAHPRYPWASDLIAIRVAVLALREAMQPKPRFRYEVLDTQRSDANWRWAIVSRNLLGDSYRDGEARCYAVNEQEAERIAALLNEAKP
jgi:hypothetical protein